MNEKNRFNERTEMTKKHKIPNWFLKQNKRGISTKRRKRKR